MKYYVGELQKKQPKKLDHIIVTVQLNGVAFRR